MLEKENKLCLLCNRPGLLPTFDYRFWIKPKLQAQITLCLFVCLKKFKIYQKYPNPKTF